MGPCEVTMNEAHSVTAGFDLEPPTEFPLTVSTTGSGEGTVECEVEAGPAEACAASYPAGAEVALTAEEETGSEFTGWSEDCSGMGPCEVTMDEAHSVTATFELITYALTVEKEGAGSGAVASSPPGIECGSACGSESAQFNEGAAVTLTATPSLHSSFSGWTAVSGDPGTCTGTASPCEVTMSEDVELEAGFAPITHSLKVSVTGQGSVSADSGPISGCTEGAGACEGAYDEGATVTLVATPDLHNRLAAWGGACAAAAASEPCEVTIDEARSATAAFEATPQHTLALATEGAGSGAVTSAPEGIKCGPECEAAFYEEETVTLTAVADPGSHLTGWEGCDTKAGSTCEVTLRADKTVKASFALNKHNLVVSTTGSGSGAVTGSLAGIDCGATCSAEYLEGTEVTLTATPAAGSTFAGWSGACLGTGACVVTLDEDRAVVANFDAVPAPPPPAKQCEDGTDNDGDGRIDYPADPGCSSSGDDNEADGDAGTPPAGKAIIRGTAAVKGGRALVKLSCRAAGPCKGTLKLLARVKTGKPKHRKIRNVLIGKASFNLAPGASRTLKVRLSRQGKRLLRSGRTLKARATGRGVKSRTVRLKRASAKRQRRQSRSGRRWR